MRKITLYRIQKFDNCTRGIIPLLEENKFLYTLEPPWRDNRPNVSCIPKGTYICKWHKSPKYGWVYMVTGVKDRSFILFHSGNIPRHTKGCILLGSKFGKLGKQPAVLISKPAVREFFDILNKQDFILEII